VGVGGGEEEEERRRSRVAMRSAQASLSGISGADADVWKNCE